PAVRLLHMIGVNAMIEQGKAMGIDTWTERERFGLSLTLGGGEVRMTDMAEVYGTLANLGKRVDLNPILSITDYKGKLIEKKSVSPISVLSPETSWIVTHILSDNWARSQAFGSNSKLVIPGKTVAVKTGTTNEKRDNWAIGYTPSYVVSVWVGNNDNTPMHPHLTSGVTGAAPIWHDIMQELLKDKQDEIFPKPEGVVAIPCYSNRTEYFIRGTELKGRCGFIEFEKTPFPRNEQINNVRNQRRITN
ncbi:MAG: penicillin-binding transpeptidase domain-containing protein, partial [Patescibacteria group bacterium]|nr:penicillin-binding transpeptidase domain-containing protein [Patescibacteria group bacterium]